MSSSSTITVTNPNFTAPAASTTTRFTSVYTNTITSPYVRQPSSVLSSLKTLTGWAINCISGGLIPNILVVNVNSTVHTPSSKSNLPTTITQFLAVNSNNRGVQSWITQKVSLTTGTYNLSFFVAGATSGYDSNNTLSFAFDASTNFLVSNYQPTTANWTRLSYTLTITTAKSYDMTFFFNNDYTNSPNGYNSTIGITNLVLSRVNTATNGTITYTNITIANFGFTAPVASTTTKITSIYTNPFTGPLVQQPTTTLSALKTLTGWTLGCVTGLLPNLFVVNVGNKTYSPTSMTNLPAGITQFLAVQNNTMGSQCWVTQSFTLQAATSYTLSLFTSYASAFNNTRNTLSITAGPAGNVTNLVSNYVPSAANWTNISYEFTTTTAGSYPIFFYFNNDYSTAPNGYNSILNITNITLIKTPPAINYYDVVVTNSNFATNVVPSSGIIIVFQKAPTVGVLNLTTVTGWTIGSVNGFNPNILLLSRNNTAYTPTTNNNLPNTFTQFYAVQNNTKGVQSWITQNVYFPIGTFSISFYVSGCKTSYNPNNTLSVSVNGNIIASGITAVVTDWLTFTYTFSIPTAGTYPLTFFFNNNYANFPNGYASIMNLTGISIIGISNPTNITSSTITSNSIAFTYTASGTSSNSSLTYYATTSPVTQTFTSTSTTMNLTGLTSNTNYTVTLYAQQNTGGLKSTNVVFTRKTRQQPPTTPSQLSVSNVTADSMRLSYSASTTDGSGITYIVTTTPVTSTFTSTDLSMSLTGLSSNTTYTLQLIARQQDISGLDSSMATITRKTLNLPPTAPSITSVSNITYNSMRLNYNASIADSSDVLIYYATTTPATNTFSSSTTSMDLSGLASNTNYTITLYAQIGGVVNSSSTTTTSKTLNGPPTTPTNLSVGSITNTTMVLSYTASTPDSSSGLTYYVTTTPTTQTFTSTTTSITLSGLTQNTSYTLTLYAKQDDSGIDSATTTINTATLRNPPSPPSQLSVASFTSSQISISYTASPTTGSSITYYATTTPATQTFSSSTTSMDLSGLSSNTTYTIRLYAFNGLDSSSITITQKTANKPPTTPSQLSLSNVTSNSMRLTYTASIGDSSSGIMYYVTTSPVTQTSTSTTTTMDISGLSSNTNYTITLYAKQLDSNMDSSSVSISRTTNRQPPSIPSDLSLSNITNNSMTLTYTASTTDGSGITYIATTSPSSQTFTSNTTTMNLTGLVSNRTYTISLVSRQTDASGLTSSAATIIGKTDYNTPTAPGFLTIGYNTSSSVKLFYTASRADASGVVYYATTIPATSTFTSTTTTMLFTQLSGNTLYTINIYGQIGNVRSATSTIYNVTPRGPPSIPTNLSVTDVSTTSMRLNYTQSTTDSTNNVLIYYATTSPATDTFTATNTNTMLLTGLSSNTEYIISLYSQQTNTGLNSPVATFTASTSHAVPSEPTFLSVTNVTSSTITLQYMESKADGPNINYRATTIPPTSEFISTTNRMTLTGLSSNTFYQIMVYAEIGGVYSTISANISTSTLNAPPSIPTNLTLQTVTSNSIQISYTGSTKDSSSAIITYFAFTSPATNIFTSTTTSITLTNMASNRSYIVYLYAEQSDSLLDSSMATIIASTLPNRPSPPRNLAVSQITSSSAILSYTASFSNNGSSGMVYYATTTPTSRTFTSTDLSMSLTDLSSNTDYTVSLYSQLTGSLDSSMVTIKLSTLHQPPTPPSNLSIGTFTDTTIQVNYTESITDGSGITYYATTYPATRTFTAVNTNSITISDLSGYTTYTIYLFARQMDIGGLDSSTVNITQTTRFSAASQPTNLAIIGSTSSSLLLSYTASIPQPNSTVTYYATTFPETTTYTSTTTTMSFTGLTNNTLYTIYLYAQQSLSGFKSETVDISGKTLHLPPSAPADLSFSNITANSFTLTYSESIADVSTGVIYVATTVPATRTFTSSTTSMDISGLTNNTTYTVVISAQIEGIKSLDSSITGTTLHLPPSTPTGLSLSSITASSMTLSYNASTADVSTGIIYYATTNPATSTFSSTTTSMSLTGLTNNQSYTVTLYSQIGGVNSLSTASVTGKTLHLPPTAPFDLSLGSITASSMILTYSASIPDSSSGTITYYATTSPATSTFTSSTTSMNLTGLSSNTTYTVTLYGRQSDSSMNSTTASTSAKTMHAPPSTPANLSLSSITSNSMVLSYNASTADASTGVIYYATTSPITTTFSSTTTSMNITGLTYNTRYTVTLYSQIGGVNSVSTATISEYTMHIPPTAPSNLSLGSITANSMILTYTASTPDSSSGTITYYATTSPATSTFTSSTTSMNLTGLSSNTTYTVTLYGRQSDSNMNSTTASTSAKTIHAPPSTPTNLSLSSITSNSMVLSYNASTADASTGVIYYATTSPTTSTFSSTTTTMNLTGLTYNTQYTVTLYSQIGGVNSVSTATIREYTMHIPPTAPSNLSLGSITAGSMVLTYTASTPDSSSGTITYYATTSPATSTFTSTTTSMNLSGLSSFTTYIVSLYGKQSDSSMNSTTVTVTGKTIHAPPSTPTDLSLSTITSSSMLLTYSASTADVSTGIIYYAKLTPSPLNSDPTLVLYYPFDKDTLNYASGTGVSNGTLVGTTTVVSANKSKFGAASLYQPNSSGTSYFSITDLIAANTDGYTFSFWLYITSSATGMVWSLSQSSASTNRIFLYYASGQLMIGTTTYTTAFTPTLNTWTHIVWTLSTSSQSKFYVNGTQQFTTTGIPYVSFLFNKSYLLGDPYGAGPYAAMIGYLEDYRYYNRVLSATEASSLYTSSGVYTSTTTSMSINNLSSNTTYSLEVYSQIEGVDSSFTSTITGTTLHAPPSTPTGLSITEVTDNSMKLTYSASTKDTSSAIITYYLTLLPPNTTYTTTDLSYTFTGLSSFTSYTIQMYAEQSDSGMDSSYATISQTTLHAPPSVPTDLSFTEITANTLKLIYTASTADASTGIIYYANISPNPLETDSALACYYTFDSDALNYATGTGVTDVSMVNGASISNSVYKKGTGSLSLTSSSSQHIKLSSNSIVNTTGFAGTNGLTFTCWFKSNTNSSWARILDFGNGANSDNIVIFINSNCIGVGVYIGGSATRYDTTNNVNYNDNQWYHLAWSLTYSNNNTSQYKVYINGTQIYSTTNSYYPRGIARSTNYIGRSNWSDPYWNGNIDDFRIYQRVLTASEIAAMSNVNGFYSSSTTDISMTGLKSNTQYTVTLYSQIGGINSLSTATLTETTLHGPPSTPSSLSLSNITANSMYLTYGASTKDTADATITYYITLLPPNQTFTTTDTSINLTDLTNNTSYTIQVYAEQSDTGMDSSMATVSGTTLHLPPSVPTDLSLSNITANSMVLTYSASTADASTGLIYYATTSPASSTFSSTTTTMNLTGLLSYQSYVVTLYSQIGGVNSESTATITGATIHGYPSTPSITYLGNITSTGFVLTYSASIPDVSGEEITYYLSISPANKNITTTSTSVSVTDLRSNKLYTITLYARQTNTGYDSSMVTTTVTTSPAGGAKGSYTGVWKVFAQSPGPGASTFTKSIGKQITYSYGYYFNKSTDGGQTFQTIAARGSEVNGAASNVTGQYVLTNKMEYSSDYGVTWSKKGYPAWMAATTGNSNRIPYNAPGVAVSDNGQYLTVVTNSNNDFPRWYSYGVFISLNSGDTWSKPTVPIGGQQTYGGNDIAMSSTGQYQVICYTPVTSGCFYSNNYGVSWYASDLPLQAPAPIPGQNQTYGWYKIAMSSSGQYCMTISNTNNTQQANGIWYSTNFGVNWSKSNASSSYNWISCCMDTTGQFQFAFNETYDYTYALGNSNNGIYISRDYGQTFSLLSNSPFQSLYGPWAGGYSSIYTDSDDNIYFMNARNIGKFYKLNLFSTLPELNTNENIILHYPFNTDLKNYASGSGVLDISMISVSNGTPSTTITNTKSKFGTGSLYHLKDSTLTVLKVNRSIPANQNGYTISFYYYMTTNQSLENGNLIQLYNNVNKSSITISGIRNGSVVSISITYANGTVKSYNTGNLWGSIYSGAWNHFAWTLDTSNNSTLYVNGYSVYTTTTLTYMSQAFTEAYFYGNMINNVLYCTDIENYFANFRYYDKVLSYNDILSLYVNNTLINTNPVADLKPTTPTNVSITNITTNSAKLTYGASIPDISSGIISYRINLTPPNINYITSDLSYSFTDLSKNTSYTMTLYGRQLDSELDSSSVLVTFTTIQNPPTTPSDLSSSQITASSFKLSYSASTPDTSGGTITYYLTLSPPNTTYTTSDVSYTFTDLSSYTNYSISVFARQSGPGPDSSSVSITTQTLHAPPTTPTDLSSSQITANSFKLTYGASRPDSSSGTITYQLTLLPPNTTYTTSDLSYTFTDLSHNTTYSVSVKSQQSDSGMDSSAVSLTTQTLHIPPTAPTDLSSSQITASSFKLSYSASTPDNSSGTITYQLTLLPPNTTYTTSDLSYTFTDLSHNTTYSVSVKSQQSDSGMDSSATSLTTKTLHIPPTAPTNLSLSQFTTSSMKVSYSPSIPDNSSGTITYQLTLLPPNTTYTTTDLSYTFTDLSTNTEYTVSIIGEQSDSGMDSSAASITGTTLRNSPSTPSNMKIANITDTSLSVRYEASTPDISGRSIQYHLTLLPPNTMYTTSDLSYTFTDLSNATQYTVYVIAEQIDSGLESAAASVIATTGNYTPPTTPTDVSFADITSNSLTLTYGASIPDNSNATVTYYLTIMPLSLTYTTTDVSYTFSQLSHNTLYTVEIFARQSDSGLDSSAVSVSRTTLHLPPTAPTNLSIANVTSRQMTVEYGASIPDNSNGTITYQLTLLPPNTTYTTSDLSYTFTDLSHNTTYTVSVIGEQSDSGMSSTSVSISGNTLHIPPTTPTDVSLSQITASSITMTYGASIPDNSSGTITYHLNLLPPNTNYTTSDLSYTFTDLAHNTEYTVGIYASQSDSGMDSSAVSVSGTTLRKPPTTPSDLLLSHVGIHTITVSYAESIPDSSSATITYYLTLLPPNTTYTTTDLSYTFTDLSDNTEYTISILGEQSDTSLDSSAASITGRTGQHIPPTTPTDVSFTQATSSTLRLTYGASTPDSSYGSIIYYLTILPLEVTYTTSDISYLFTDLTSNTSYTVNVFARQNNSGLDSSAVSVIGTTLHAPPTAPTDLSFSQITANSLRLTYGASTPDTSSGTITYQLTLLPPNTTYTTTDLSYTFTDLSHNTEYSVSVIAQQSDSGMDSSAVSLTTQTLHIPPTAPTDLSFTQVTSNTLRLTYGASTPDNSSGIITYQLTLLPPNTTYTTTDLSYTFTGLSHNTTYTVSVIGEQSDSGLDSSAVSITTQTLHIPPTAPTDLSFAQITASSIRLSYGASTPDNSSGTITYQLTLLPPNTTYTTTDLSYTFGDLSSNTLYTISIVGEQSDSGLDSSAASISTTTLHKPPSTPTDLSLSQITSSTMKVSYGASIPDSSSTTVTYYLTLLPPDVTYTTNDLSYIFTDLSSRTNYIVSMYGKQQDSGMNSATISTNGTTLHNPPTAPTDLSFTEISYNSLKLTYGASIPDGSSGTITYYLTLLPPDITYNTSDLSYTFTDLSSNTSYTVSMYGQQSDSGFNSSMVSVNGQTSQE